METVLEIKGIGFPAFSCRDVKQTLVPIATGEMCRTVNGELRHIGSQNHKKFKTTLRCHDQALPGMQQSWVGAPLTVHCVSILFEQFESDELVKLSRAPVPGSVSVMNYLGHKVSFEIEGDCILSHESPQGILRISYRPILEMRLISFEMQEQEWGDGASWQMLLEEI